MKTEKKITSKLNSSKEFVATESLEDLYKRYFISSENRSSNSTFEQVSLFDYSMHVSSSSSTPIDTAHHA